MPNLYEEPLANIHDAGFGDFARQAGGELLDLFSRHALRDGTVVDLGCGGGIWAEAMIDAGLDVVGVDISPAMIALARKRAPRATFHVGSCYAFPIPRCRAVTALGEVLNYRSHRKNDRAALARLFKRVYSSLEHDGLFIFDLAEPGRHESTPRSFWEGDDWAVLVEFETDRIRNRLTRRITSFRRVGKHFRRDKEVHALQLYRSTEITAMLREIGFVVTVRGHYGHVTLFPNTTAFIARKQ